MSAEEPASHRGRSQQTRWYGNLFLITLPALIGLKLGGVITWSWWGVFAPVWVPLAVILVIALPLAGLALASRIGDHLEDRRYRRLDRPPPWIGSRL